MTPSGSTSLVVREHQLTYFGLPIRDDKVPLSEIARRDFYPRWQAIMGNDTAHDGFVSLTTIKRFAQLYALEI